jgi:hypothetical protein
MEGRQSDEYSAWTRAVRARDGNKCQFPNCKKRTRLEVHHIIPWSKSAILRHDIGNVICLCRAHHKSIKGKENYYVGLFNVIVSSKKK